MHFLMAVAPFLVGYAEDHDWLAIATVALFLSVCALLPLSFLYLGLMPQPAATFGAIYCYILLSSSSENK
jgi:hypothetical protein